MFSNTNAVQYHRGTQAVRDDGCAFGVRLLVPLRGRQEPSVGSSSDENSPVFEQCGRLKGAWGLPVALRRRKGLAGKIEQLRSCDGIPVVVQEASRHEHRSAGEQSCCVPLEFFPR